MGGFFSINLEEQYKKNEKFLESLNQAAMEKQIQLQNQMAVRQRATGIAMSRDFFTYIATFSGIVTTGLLAGYTKAKRPALLVPLLPLSFLNVYYYDMAYGNKLHRVRTEAEHVMRFESDLLAMPCGLPSPSSIDQSRIEDNDKKH